MVDSQVHRPPTCFWKSVGRGTWLSVLLSKSLTNGQILQNPLQKQLVGFGPWPFQLLEYPWQEGKFDTTGWRVAPSPNGWWVSVGSLSTLTRRPVGQHPYLGGCPCAPWAEPNYLSVIKKLLSLTTILWLRQPQWPWLVNSMLWQMAHRWCFWWQSQWGENLHIVTSSSLVVVVLVVTLLQFVAFCAPIGRWWKLCTLLPTRPPRSQGEWKCQRCWWRWWWWCSWWWKLVQRNVCGDTWDRDGGGDRFTALVPRQ